jgi:HAD superfamily hydrolase (TIGR01509 family)
VDEIIISAEEGVIKPDRRIFEIAMSRLGTTPERSLLLDDHLPNVMAAREFGMHAVQFISPHQAIETVRIHLDGRQS